MAEPIQTRLRLLFGANGTDVTADLTPDLLSFEYVDNDGGQADEIRISLMDPTGRWAGAWRPDGGEIVKAWLSSGTTTAPVASQFCGTFFVDRLSASGTPRTAEISAVSVPLSTPIRRQKKKRAWEGQRLSQIAKGLAQSAELALFFDAREDPLFDRQDQNDETDLAFLKRLADSAGLSVKVTDEQLAIFSQSEYEAREPVKTIVLGASPVLSWSFEQSQSETYKAVTVKYRDPKQKKAGAAGGFQGDFDLGAVLSKPGKNPAVMTYTYEDESAGAEGQTFEIKTRAKSIAEAKRIAKAKLRELNRRSVTGRIALVGDATIAAATVVKIEGFGSFDGNFYVDCARHSVSGSGYVTEIQIHRCLKDY